MSTAGDIRRQIRRELRGDAIRTALTEKVRELEAENKALREIVERGGTRPGRGTRLVSPVARGELPEAGHVGGMPAKETHDDI